jgi:hypothetical protein
MIYARFDEGEVFYARIPSRVFALLGIPSEPSRRTPAEWRIWGSVMRATRFGYDAVYANLNEDIAVVYSPCGGEQ